MKKIRNNIFETNSSSTHAICFGNDINELPKKLYFGLGEFGRAEERVDPYDYLFTAICDYYGEEEWKEKWGWVVKVLKDHGCEDVKWEDPKWKHTKWGSYPEGYWSVDHSCELTEFLDSVIGNEEMLLKYLTSKDTFVETSEDDWDTYDNCTLPNKYMKGN